MMAHLEKYSRSQLGHILKNMTPGRKEDQNGNYIKFGNEEIGTNRTHLVTICERKDGLSDYDFVKIDNGIPC